MADITYRMVLAADHPYVRGSGDAQFRCQFGGDGRRREAVTGSEWVVPVGGTITTGDSYAQRVIPLITDDIGAAVFVRDDVADRGTELDTEVFDRFRTQRIR